MEVIFKISLIVVKDPEKLGLIRRIKDSNDNRLTIISLTSVGKHKIEVILPQHYKNITEIFNVLIDKEKEVLKTILDRGPCQYKEYEIYII